MSYLVSSKRPAKIVLNERDPVKAVLQNVKMILITRQNSIPLYRDFGLPMQFVDKPTPAAKPLMVAEIRDAIGEYEPRAKVINVTFEIDEKAPGKLIPTLEIEVELNE